MSFAESRLRHVCDPCLHRFHVIDAEFLSDLAQVHSACAEFTGFGLAFSQEIVVKHGGSIEVSSTPEEGSTFTVRLPLCPDGL